jgi:ATP phosphoribosyltransferase
MKKNKLKFGFPIGALRQEVLELFLAAGYDIKFSEHIQKIDIDDAEIDCVLVRPIPMASLIEKGFLDVGISTDSAVLETRAKVNKVCDLEYIKPPFPKMRIVVGAPESSKIRTLKNLAGKKIITRIPNIAKEFLKKNKISAEILYSDAPINEPIVGVAADAIIEFFQFGEFFKAYKMKVIATIMERSLILIANENSLNQGWKKEKIKNLAILLKGARLGQEMAGLMLHASNDTMEEVLKILPSLKKPTVTQLRGENWFDVLTVANKKEIRKIVPKLKKIGCKSIVEFPLNKVVL